MMTDAEILKIPTMHETNLDGKNGLRLQKRGKVRDIYETLGKDYLFIVTTDRISAFDSVLPRDIPDKGRCLNGTSAWSFDEFRYIAPNHFIDSPDPNVMVVQRVDERYPIEVVVRGLIAGSLWKRYAAGERRMYGCEFRGGLLENQELSAPIVTPTTKAEKGHDIPLESDEEVVAVIAEKMGMTRAEARRDWQEIKETAVELYTASNEIIRENDGKEADTKFEVGRLNGNIIYIDEIITPDSSRFVGLKEYKANFEAGKPQIWYDKQVVRNWLEKTAKWTGEGKPPAIPDDIVALATQRYLQCYKLVTGADMPALAEPPTDERILRNIFRK